MVRFIPKIPEYRFLHLEKAGKLRGCERGFKIETEAGQRATFSAAATARIIEVHSVIGHPRSRKATQTQRRPPATVVSSCYRSSHTQRERANPFLSTCYTQHNSMIAPQRRRAAAATPTATTASRRPSFLPLLLLASALHPSSSFLFPITAVSGLPPSCKTWSASLRPQSASSSSDVGEPVQSSELGGAEDEVDDAADGRPTSPAGLTLEGVYKRLKLECVDIDEGAVQLESKDTDYGVRRDYTRNESSDCQFFQRRCDFLVSSCSLQR